MQLCSKLFLQTSRKCLMMADADREKVRACSSSLFLTCFSQSRKNCFGSLPSMDLMIGRRVLIDFFISLLIVEELFDATFELFSFEVAFKFLWSWRLARFGESEAAIPVGAFPAPAVVKRNGAVSFAVRAIHILVAAATRFR